MSLLLTKLLLMPLVMAVVTLAGRRWGNKVGGVIASMPWIAGPILLFFILEQGKAFGIRAAPGVLTGILSLIAFCLSYALLSRRFSWWLTLPMAYAVYVSVALLFTQTHLSLPVVYGIVLACVALTLRLFPVPTNQSVQPRRLPYNLVIRMVVATLFMLTITALARLLGPTWSGILTPFPIITSILAVFTHVSQGSNGAIVSLRGIMIGLFGFTTFLFLQAFFLREFSVGLSFGLALCINAVINLVAVRVC
ncbi:hypothetical protein J2I47_10555 [Fibrella sp. HMF5335]|uniref:Uncharacterized protein n=1 Tax=Fibrella rubiginis TaxID=2817060 RepID=A0A939K5Z4_9BACT|nr:hypothetical protein [Fibrella rubiginis]MBO0936985.1 hypothetical protein [Fibrella rubiginis]